MRSSQRGGRESAAGSKSRIRFPPAGGSLRWPSLARRAGQIRRSVLKFQPDVDAVRPEIAALEGHGRAGHQGVRAAGGEIGAGNLADVEFAVDLVAGPGHAAQVDEVVANEDT